MELTEEQVTAKLPEFRAAVEGKYKDLKDDSFPAELKEREFLFWKGVNNKGEKILQFKVLKHKKGALVEEVKRYIAYVLDCHQKASPGIRMVLIFNFNGAGVTNMIACLSLYLTGCETFWKIIQSWLSDDQKKKIIMVKKKEITKYINEGELEQLML
ncbi:hypothetical protein LSH36_197g01032 [Paralvinella palmiformis]|uniref:CRAL-TRIO domain-containing protein n=1 Tax=Paralvinella palmiformis TaxID=53620 RepID=A0AAD9N4U3_9ANNE|nr:hypothetical protein LSH36_197g01032 [Paralvinella palmiformis]